MRPDVWSRLKNLTADEIIRALERDNWTQDEKRGAILAYRNHDGMRRVTVHYHPKKTYGPSLLKGLLRDIGWTEQDMRRLKLI